MSSNDYLTKPFSYKLKKVARYVRLYGPSRTFTKILGQYHQKNKNGFSGSLWENSKCVTPNHQMRNIGIIGCGSFAFTTIAYYLNKQSKVFLRGAFDINAAPAKSLVTKYGGAYATTDAERVINDPAIQLIYIASNHASHADYAIRAIKAGKDVHIEKPHIVSQEQLDGLIDMAVFRPNSFF